MKKTIAAIAASAILVTSFAVAAPAASASTSVTPAVAQTLTSNDNLFVKLVRKEDSVFKKVPSATMVKTAKATCKFIRSGFSTIDAVNLMEESGFSNNASLAFVAGAVVFYCPEQQNNF